jgi:hypothetical protein
MARFYGSVDGARRTVGTLGHKEISSHTRGWDFGIRVEGRIDAGEDSFAVYLTAGSNGHASDRLLGTFTRRDLESKPRRLSSQVRAFAEENSERESSDNARDARRSR